MKTVEFQGAEFEVPDWARWIAQDSDGSICVYENKPYEDDTMYKPNDGKMDYVVMTGAPMVLKEIE